MRAGRDSDESEDLLRKRRKVKCQKEKRRIKMSNEKSRKEKYRKVKCRK